jgi:hypothetical protein
MGKGYGLTPSVDPESATSDETGRDLLLGDGVPCVGAHAGCSQSTRGSMHLFPLCAQQSHRGREAPSHAPIWMELLG